MHGVVRLQCAQRQIAEQDLKVTGSAMMFLNPIMALTSQ